jgi:stromal membrane-associated protein
VSLEMGNAKANAFWEAELRPSFKRPSENDHAGLESFIRSKYIFLSVLET